MKHGLTFLLILFASTAIAEFKETSTQKFERHISQGLLNGSLLKDPAFQSADILGSQPEALRKAEAKAARLRMDHVKQSQATFRTLARLRLELNEANRRLNEGDTTAEKEKETLLKQIEDTQQQIRNNDANLNEDIYHLIKDSGLLGHQLKRIRKIYIQDTATGMSGFPDEFGIVLALSKDLKLSHAEQKKIAAITEKERKAFYKETTPRKQKGIDRIVAALSTDKQKALNTLIGQIDIPSEPRPGTVRYFPRQEHKKR